MSYTTRVNFHGLCGIVPGGELSDPLPWVGIFLVNADANNQTNFGAESLPVHLPFLRYRLSDQQGQGAPNAFGFASVLNQDIVLLPPPGSPAEDLHADFDPAADSEPTDTQKTLLNWVVNVSDVASEDEAVVDSDCFERAPRERRVATRVHLLQGHLQANPDRLSHNNGGLIQARLGNSKKRQVVAGSYFVDIACADGPFTVRMNDFGKPVENRRDVTFPQPQGDRLEISFINLCPNEIFLEPGSQLVAPGPDNDFRWNFLLSDANFDISNFSVPVAELPLQVGDIGGLDAVRCSPPRFTAVGKTTATSMAQLGRDLSA
jgi:hypothetical protein